MKTMIPLIVFILILYFTGSHTQEQKQDMKKISVDSQRQEYYDINIIKNEDNNCDRTDILNLSDMDLRVIKDNIIQSNHIGQISLENNLLENIPNILSHVPYLKCLNLSRNRINFYNDISITHNTLEVLDLSYQHISSIVNPLVEFVEETQNNNIQHINSQFTMFNTNAIYFPNLKFLYLSGNDISILSPHFEVAFPQLTHLYLININAETLQKQFPNKIPKSLRVLHLENNLFHNLTLENINEITTLYLDHNPLNQIEIVSTNLKILSLANCTKLTYAFIDIPHLEKLDLSMNNFDDLFNIHLQVFQFLRTLLLDRNKLSEIPLLSNLRQLVELSLSYNMIRDIKSNSFVNLESLKKLSLKGNRIERIEQYTFSNLKNLKYLDLSENKLTNLHNNWMLPLINLRFLNANSNKFTSISHLAIEPISQLEYLSVKNNTFKEITTIELEDLPNYITIYLA